MITFFKCPTKPNMNCAGRAALSQCKGCGDHILKDGEIPIMKESNGMMIYWQNNHERVFAQCNCALGQVLWGDPEEVMGDVSEAFAKYDSVEEAHEAGWRYTNHIKFCDPNKPAQWVCPDCAGDYTWEKETIYIKRAYDNRVLRYDDRGINNG